MVHRFPRCDNLAGMAGLSAVCDMLRAAKLNLPVDSDDFRGMMHKKLSDRSNKRLPALLLKTIDPTKTATAEAKKSQCTKKGPGRDQESVCFWRR